MMNIKNKRGQSAITLALLTTTFLVLAGFSLDIANVLLKKSRLQRALDAGVIAGITRYSTAGEEDPIEDIAREMALYNLREMGIDNANISADFPLVELGKSRTLTLNGSITSATLFMRLIPGAGLGTVVTSASSAGTRNPAIISLVLDISGSMKDEIIQLQGAAIEFVRSFQEGVDNMALISFADKAFLEIPMAAVDKQNLNGAISTLTADGYTGTAEAITLGRRQIETIGEDNPEAVRAILLFTDGAPTSVRPIFTDAQASLPKNHPEGYDYVARLNRDPRVPDIVNPNAITKRCRWDCPAGTNTNIASRLNSFAYQDSRTNPGHFTHITSLNSPYDELQKESYDLAIIESDYAKNDGITIYTVGLGIPSTDTSSPYQGVKDTHSLKPFFLRRLANDPASESDPVFGGTDPLIPNPNHPKGIYLQTDNPNDLKNLFESIAERIKLRLI
ncbi:MAG: VWA domain-containing protein [Candidatus Omnitrophica bacterium]|nr:VWA domain-containing protein [Candidatus Omnitrophota bacterium]